jgi:ribulose-5-phosphate 4-epimerase/fuculose-1-phosphate aldolase
VGQGEWFKGRQFTAEVILWAVHWCLMYSISYHTACRPSQEECDALGATCAKGSCVVLLNHGLLTWGRDHPRALMRLYMLERACELEVMAG